MQKLQMQRKTNWTMVTFLGCVQFSWLNDQLTWTNVMCTFNNRIHQAIALSQCLLSDMALCMLYQFDYWMLMNSMNNGNIQKAGSFPLLRIPNCKIIASFAYIKYESANHLSCLQLEFVYFIVDIIWSFWKTALWKGKLFVHSMDLWPRYNL